MRLTSAEVDRYGPLVDCRPPCEDDVTVVAGPNEAGKTLYLEAVLQLLDPETATVMEPKPRVDEEPDGRIEIEHNGQRHVCDGDSALTDVVDIDPAHLESLFVVRDNDLHLPDSQDYYTSLIEKLGNIHTSEINSIKTKLKERGRLTETTLKISSNNTYHSAGDVRDHAQRLADEIKEYTTTVEEQGLDDLEAERFQVRRRLERAEERLSVQRRAETLANHERLRSQLRQYRETTAMLAELEAFDRDSLDELKNTHDEIDRHEKRLERLGEEIEDQKSTITDERDRHEAAEGEQTELEQRRGDVEDAKSALREYRNHQDDATGVRRQLTLTKYATPAALVGAGGVGAVSVATDSTIGLGLAGVLFVAGVVGAIGYRRANRRLVRVETATESVLRAARDAGLDVDAIDEVGQAVESFGGELTRARERAAKAEEAHRAAEEELEDLERERRQLTEQVSEEKRELEANLDEAGVDSIERYEAKVERREELTPDRRAAEQSLTDAFGEPDASDPESKATAWEREVESLIEDVDEDAVTAADYDEGVLAALDREVDELDDELRKLENRLGEYDDRLDEYDSEAAGLTTEPFVGETLQLDSRSKQGLESLAVDLEVVVDRIETDAELSRNALELFDRLEAAEEQKLTTLFEPDGPASQVFEQITDGRYREVTYDADGHEITVERDDGRLFSLTELSQGTRDQLYFATRVSLAKQLLGHEPGFFLLDDPFLGADPQRLRRGFRTLQRLSEEGWQILYFTAKEEVRETMVEEYDFSLVDMSEFATPP